MPDPVQTGAVNAAVAAAKSLPELKATLSAVDPALAKSLTDTALITSKTPWGVLVTYGLTYLAAKYGLGWDPDFIALVAGLGVLGGSYLMRAISSNQRITGWFTAASKTP